MLGGTELKPRAKKMTGAGSPQAAELTLLKFGSNFFVNLDKKLN